MVGGDDRLLRIAGLELFRQGSIAELAADLGGLETLAVVGIDFPLLVLHALDRDAASVEFVEEHGETRQAFSFVLLEQGIADVPHLLLRVFSCRIGLSFSMWLHGSDFFCDGQPILATEFFGYSRGSVTDEGGVVDLPAEADPIGDDVDVQVVGVFVRDGHPLVIVQPHLLGKEQGEAVQGLERHPRLVLRSDADLDAQELVFAATIVVIDQLHFLVNLLRYFSAEVVEGEKPAELSLTKNVLQRVASVCDGLTLCDHDLRYLGA